MEALFDALLLRAGYNAALVAIGAGLLGIAAGAVGTFLFLRKRALLSDAISHATLPGLCLAFLALVALGGDGRNLAGLLFGSALTAGIGLLAVEAMTARTRLPEDAAIGAVLSTFFGAGIVLLTIIQTVPSGKQAGLQSFLLGSTAGLLFQDAVIIAAAGGLAVLAVLALRRPMMLVAFDADYAAALGFNVRGIDRAMMLLGLCVVVIGLTFVGLVLILALLIIPPVAARFWSERSGRVLAIAALIGGLAGYGGAALSAVSPRLPTGPIIVLVAFALFLFSFLAAPGRGIVAAFLCHRRFQRRVHARQGLLALAHGEPIHDPLTLRVLRRGGLIRADGVATPLGKARAAKALRDEHRWAMARTIHGPLAVPPGSEAGLHPVEAAFTPDELAYIDRCLGGPKPAETA